MSRLRLSPLSRCIDNPPQGERPVSRALEAARRAIAVEDTHH